MTTISVRVPEELVGELDNVAKESSRPRSFIILKAIEAYLDSYADLQVALDRLHDVSDPTVSPDEMRRSLDL